ncbi:MAG TPA: hypothetical protein PK390_03845, partial [Fervidobacterium nodosum]|nr:hypothetical protein [Fervidobacterium nodosum]
LTNNLSVQQNINKQFVKQSVNSHSENLDDDFSQVHKYSTDEQGGNLKMENAGQVETTDFKKQYDDLLSEHNELKKHFDELKHSYEKLQKTLDNLL